MSLFNRTRILYVNHTGQVSGAERVLIDTIRMLDRERYEPVVSCPLNGSLAHELSTIDASLAALPPVNARFTWRPDHALKALPAFLKSVLALRKQIRSLSPDLIHANTMRAGMAASIASVGIATPVIWHVHDTLRRHPVSTVLRLLVLMRRRTHVIAVSHAAAHSFRGSLPLAQKISTIHNGIDLDRFSADRSGTDRFRDSLGISEKNFLVCAVGQICARKGLLELIRAFAAIHHKEPHMHLAIVGRVVFQHEGEYLKALHAAVKEANLENHVHFTGEIRDVPGVLRSADLLVLNSKDEPFGLVIIEAMASGTPVLATRVGGIPEIITDSENGWLVPFGDMNALATKLLQLSGDNTSLRRSAEEARRVTCPRFSLARYQNELAALYARLVPHSDPQWRRRGNPVLVKSANQ